MLNSNSLLTSTGRFVFISDFIKPTCYLNQTVWFSAGIKSYTLALKYEAVVSIPLS